MFTFEWQAVFPPVRIRSSPLLSALSSWKRQGQLQGDYQYNTLASY